MTDLPDLPKTALLSIDLQNENRPTGAWPVADFDQLLANAATVIAAARHAGVPVVHIQAWSTDGQTAYSRLTAASTPGGLAFGLADSAGAAICAEVAPSATEQVVKKSFPNAFRDTNLGDLLRRLGIEHVLAIGVWTESCVRETVFDAIYQGYRAWLVKDAIGSGTRTMHRAGLLDLANRLYGGGVFRTADAVGFLKGETPEIWRFRRPVAFSYTAENLDALYDAL